MIKPYLFMLLVVALLPFGALAQTATPASAPAPAANGERSVAVFAGGCFWCMVQPFKSLRGVSKVVSGYTGGAKENPTYEEVSSGTTGHLEAVEVTYDAVVVPYETLLQTFWHQIDPTDAGGSFVDRGEQYRSAIFYASDAQKKAAEKSKAEVQKKFTKPVATQIRAASKFYPAEDYHQDYYLKNPVRYKYYRFRSGRDQFIEKTWGKEFAHPAAE